MTVRGPKLGPPKAGAGRFRVSSLHQFVYSEIGSGGFLKVDCFSGASRFAQLNHTEFGHNVFYPHKRPPNGEGKEVRVASLFFFRELSRLPDQMVIIPPLKNLQSLTIQRHKRQEFVMTVTRSCEREKSVVFGFYFSQIVRKTFAARLGA